MTKQDINGLKGAMRRVFSRSDLRKSIVVAAKVDHYDSERPRVKKWVKCAGCLNLVPEYTTAVDHILPVIPINNHFEDMSLDESIDRMWCEASNLQVLCDPCHSIKSKLESEQRKPYRKPRAKRK